MEANFVTRALGFHGQPLQMIWEDEHGAGDLQRLGVPQQINYAIYQERQRNFTFQDRAKRLKLHQFLARKAQDLYDKELKNATGVLDEEHLRKAMPLFAIMPPYEVFINKQVDRIKRLCSALEGIQPGDIVYGIVTRVNLVAGSTPLMIKPLCTAEPLVRYLSDIPMKAFVNVSNLGPLPMDKRGMPRRYALNELVCCAVLEISIDADRLYLSMEPGAAKNQKIPLGLVQSNDLPPYYHIACNNTKEKYSDCLRSYREFQNPNYDILYSINGLNVNDTFTMMGSLKHPFPRADYGKALRQTQASQWAVR